MRKKRLLANVTAMALFGCASLFAYNPPLGGENLLRYGHADLVSQTASAAGGPLFTATPQSIVINPALIAGFQRVSADLGYTGLFPAHDDSAKLGHGIQLGMAFPSRWGVAAGALHAVFSDYLGNSFLARGAFSRDVTDNLYVGASLFGGANTGHGDDWALALDLGFWYRLGDLGFFKDVRIGAALSNLGKTFVTSAAGIKSADDSDFFPGILTPRAGIAAKLLDLDKLDAGLSLDISVPFFQNAVIDAGAQMCFVNMITLSVGWQLNMVETIESHTSFLPSVGLSFKFKVNTGGSEFMSSKGWDTTDFTTAANWRQVYDDIQQISAGVTANFGLRDSEGPSISMWGE
jgi:hypothetical protein